MSEVAAGPVVGRTRITTRAMSRVISAVAASSLGVEAKSVDIDLGDDQGKLLVEVRSPLRVPSLTRVQQEPGSIARVGGTVIQRAEDAQRQIRQRASELTGSEIARVVVHLDGVIVKTEKRVQ